MGRQTQTGKRSRQPGRPDEVRHEHPEKVRKPADLKDDVLDPPDAPRKPPPGTGGGDGAPMG